MFHQVERQLHPFIGVRDRNCDLSALTVTGWNLHARSNGHLNHQVALVGAAVEVAPRHVKFMLVGGEHNQRLPLLGDGLVDGIDRAVEYPRPGQGPAIQRAGRGNAHGKTGQAHGN